MRGFFNLVSKVDVKTGFDAYASAVQDDNFVGTLTMDQAKIDYAATMAPRGCIDLTLI